MRSRGAYCTHIAVSAFAATITSIRELDAGRQYDSKRFPGEFVCTKRLNGRTARRFISILTSSALAYTDSAMELNRTLFSCLERKCLRSELRGVLDHYSNVRLGVSGREM